MLYFALILIFRSESAGRPATVETQDFAALTDRSLHGRQQHTHVFQLPQP